MHDVHNTCVKRNKIKKNNKITRLKNFFLTCPQLLSSERAVRDKETTDERCLFAQQISSFHDSCGIEDDQA